MKKTTLKLALILACFALTVTACKSNKKAEGTSDSDSAIMKTDTIMTDTAGIGKKDTTVTDTMGTGKETKGSGKTPKP